MLYKIYNTYKELLDVKLKDSTFLVIIIALLIISAGAIIPNKSFVNSKNNILEIQKINNTESNNIINIDWKNYRIYFEEIK